MAKEIDISNFSGAGVRQVVGLPVGEELEGEKAIFGQSRVDDMPMTKCLHQYLLERKKGKRFDLGDWLEYLADDEVEALMNLVYRGITSDINDPIYSVEREELISLVMTCLAAEKGTTKVYIDRSKFSAQIDRFGMFVSMEQTLRKGWIELSGLRRLRSKKEPDVIITPLGKVNNMGEILGYEAAYTGS